MAQLQGQGRVQLEHAAPAKLQTASDAHRVCAMAAPSPAAAFA
ncbi:hypothetical protein ACVGVM_18990 [Pseudonocardia bannensis]|nr:hypothetical protein [Pseudonocardia bannensis]